MTEPGFIVLYRWRLRPGYEAQFRASWSIVTRSLMGRGSLGSRLHEGDDGLWYAYAQWPSADIRSAAFAQDLGVDQDRQAMQDAVLEHFPETVLTPSVGHLLSTPSIPKMRVARPTAEINRAITFWTEFVGLEILSQFENHDDYDGAILGYPDTAWELEVIRHASGTPLPSPTDEDIFILYLRSEVADAITGRLQQAGQIPHDHSNPYWKAMGASVYFDPDGYTFIVFPLD